MTSKESNEPRYMCIRILLDDGETEKPMHLRVVEAAAYDVAVAEIERLREALEVLLPGLILDLRYCDEDDDKDALRARVATVREALEPRS